MDRIQTLTIFRRVAELRSFSGAARELGLSNAAVSKHVRVLEERLGATLLHRTTRRVALTATGRAYLTRCAHLLDELDELDQAVASSTTTIKGVLRINVPTAFGLLHLSPVLPALMEAWPDLTVEMSMSDRFVDLVEEGVDVAIRVASSLPDSATLVARRLAGADLVVCATPRYLREQGAPESPLDLTTHRCLIHGVGRRPWIFTHDGETVEVQPDGRLVADNSLALRDALLANAGIALMPTFYVHEHVAARRLVVLLPEWNAPPVWIHAVYPSHRHLSSKVRVFVDHVRTHVQRAPWALPVDGKASPRGPRSAHP